MPTITGDNNSVIINLTDSIPPENMATVDKNGMVGNTYTKVQFDDRFNAKSAEINTQIEDIKQAVETDFKGTINPSGTAPTEDGSYKPEVSSKDNIGVDPLNYGTLYANAGNLRAKEGYDTIFYKKGNVWKKSENKMPEAPVVSAEFDKTSAIKPQGGQQIKEYFSTVKILDNTTTEITDRIQNGVINDQGQFAAINGYTTTGLVNVSNAIKIKVQDLNAPTEDYSVKFYDVNKALVLNHRQKGTYELNRPANAVYFMMNVVTATTTLMCFKVEPGQSSEDLGTSSVVDILNPDIMYMPVNSVGVQHFLDQTLEDIREILGNIKLYETHINDLRVSIDDFSGTDDVKIEKAVAMLENVGGGEVYFPPRQINITHAILVPSNFRFLLDGENCKVQMADGIHDNIFRAKGLKINPAAPNGIQPGADLTQNFEIIGIGTGMPSIRQSVNPLHTGDKFGWRGISMEFPFCKTYKVHNIKIVESHMWSISNEYSEYGTWGDFEFSNTLYPNADGLNFRNGCRHHRAKKLRGLTNDNAVAVTILDGTWPVNVGPNAGYSWQALGYNFSDFNGAYDIIVEDVQVRSRFGAGLIIGTSHIVSNITFKDFVSTSHTPTGEDWDNVAVCGNRFRTYVYGNSYVDGNVRNINVINSKTSVHEYSLAVYGGKINNLFAVGTTNTNPSGLGVIKNDTTTVIN